MLFFLKIAVVLLNWKDKKDNLQIENLVDHHQKFQKNNKSGWIIWIHLIIVLLIYVTDGKMLFSLLTIVLTKVKNNFTFELMWV